MSLASSQNPVTSVLSASDVGIADAGGYFTALTPTPGTGVVGPVSTTFSEILALLSIYNGSPTASIYLRALRLHVTVVGTTGVSVKFTQAVDQGNRFTSGGSALTPNNTNMASSVKSAAQINFGALVTTAASSQRRILHHTQYKPTAVEVAEDMWQFSWGGATQLEDPASLITNTTTLSYIAYSFAPIVIGPNQTYTLHQWRAAITVGITQEAELSYLER